jgi:hypothetical protein
MVIYNQSTAKLKLFNFFKVSLVHTHVRQVCVPEEMSSKKRPRGLLDPPEAVGE